MTPSPERERARVGIDVKALADRAKVWYPMMSRPQAQELARLAEFAALVLEEAAKIADGVDNYANPMTAGDVADAIRALKPLPVPVAANEGAT